MNNIDNVSDKHMMAFIDAVIPVLEDLKAVGSNWDGDEPGEAEHKALLAGEIASMLQAVGNDLSELRGDYHE